MTNKINNILLCLLWTIAITLGACFWFNTMFGFNLLLGAHWHHLAYMQAAQNPVKTSFYISLVCFVVILIYGLYVLMRPNLNNKKPRQKVAKTKQEVPTAPKPHPVQTPAPEPKPEPVPVPAPVTNETPAAEHNIPYSNPTQNTATPESEANLTRPPRLNLPIAPPPPPAPTTTNQPPDIPMATAAPQQSATQPADWMRLGEIFTDTGYTVKTAPNINGLQTSLFAIGSNETVWIGAIGIKTNILDAAINVVRQVFTDTLEDIEITVHGFIISAPDAANPTVPSILTFDSPNNLREYMNEHRNPPLPSDDNGNFDAFSSYISTVIDYIEKL